MTSPGLSPRASFSRFTYRVGTTSAAGLSGSVRAWALSWSKRTATTDSRPTMASRRPFVFSWRSVTRQPDFNALKYSSTSQRFS